MSTTQQIPFEPVMRKLTMIDKIKIARDLVTCSPEHIVSYKITKELELVGISNQAFYYLIYAGCLTWIGSGKYTTTELFYYKTPDQIYKDAVAFKAKRTKENQESIPVISSSNTATIVSINDDPEATAIKLLKDLGYKILKPTKEFKEV